MKKVLILCTGNSCRSIMAEGLINRFLDGVEAFSAGSNPAGFVEANSKKVLEKEGAWRDSFYSKSVDEVEGFAPFDLVITVCDSAKESCPNYPHTKKQLHFGIKDPAKKPLEEFEEVVKRVKLELFPLIEQELL